MRVTPTQSSNTHEFLGGDGRPQGCIKDGSQSADRVVLLVNGLLDITGEGVDDDPLAGLGPQVHLHPWHVLII